MFFVKHIFIFELFDFFNAKIIPYNIKIWYNIDMKKHWSVNEENMKNDPVAQAIWTLEERINHGIGGEKIDKNLLIKYWNQISIDTFKRAALARVLNLAV